MFDSQKVKDLNELELIVYTFIVENMEHVGGMTIRDLSDSCHVSTSTILRCLTKLGYSGYTEFNDKVNPLKLFMTRMSTLMPF